MQVDYVRNDRMMKILSRQVSSGPSMYAQRRVLDQLREEPASVLH